MENIKDYQQYLKGYDYTGDIHLSEIFANTNVKPFIFEQNSGILEHRHIDFST